MSTNQLNLDAAQFSIRAKGGNDVGFTVVFPYDATAGTHTLLFSTIEDGEAVESFTSGDGLTIGAYSGGETRVTVAIPRTFTDAYRKQTIYFSYQLELSSSLRTQATGSFTLGGDIYAASP